MAPAAAPPNISTFILYFYPTLEAESFFFKKRIIIIIITMLIA